MKSLALLSSAVLMTLSLATTAHAALKCDGDYQVVDGKEISTPYCRDNYLAHVARQYGVHVTDGEIRDNPARRSEVRRMIGYDIRVR